MKRIFSAIAFALVLMFVSSCGKDVPEKEQDEEELVPEDGCSAPEGVPTVFIDTPGAKEIVSKDEYMEGATIRMAYAPDKDTIDLGTISIKGRGNSSWGYPKKPYTIKFSKKRELLGMPESKKWCLLANWMDRTLLRNDVAFEIARRCPGMDWNPHGEFVELVLNGKKQGNYFLCEHIEISKTRINLGKGGYLLELDTYFDEPYKFRSATDLPVMIKDWKALDGESDDELSPERLSAIESEFNEVDLIMQDNTLRRAGKYEELIDTDSYIDWWIVQELMGNGEAYHPKSSYMHKDAGGKFVAGPVWDFDWNTLVPGQQYKAMWTIWYKYLMNDSDFRKKVSKRWNEVLKPVLEDIPDYIDMRAARIRESAMENCNMWPIDLTVNGDEHLSFDVAVARIRSAYIQRFNFLDKEMADF